MANKCPKCGFEYGEFDIFCARCGAKIASDDIAIKNIIKEEMDKKQEEDSKAVLNSVKKDDSVFLKNNTLNTFKRNRIVDLPIFRFAVFILVLISLFAFVLDFVLNKHYQQKRVLQYNNLLLNPQQIPLLKEPDGFRELKSLISSVDSFLLLYLKYSEDNSDKKNQIFNAYLKEMDKLPHIEIANLKKGEVIECDNISDYKSSKICASKLNKEFYNTPVYAYPDYNKVILYPNNKYIKKTFSKYLASQTKEYLKLRAQYNGPVSVDLSLKISPKKLADKIASYEQFFIRTTDANIKEDVEKVLYSDFRKFIFTPSIYATTTQEMKNEFKNAYKYFIKTKNKSMLRPLIMSYLDKQRSYSKENFKNDYPYGIFEDNFEQNIQNSSFSDIFSQLRKVFFTQSTDLDIVYIYNIATSKFYEYNSENKLTQEELLISKPDANNNITIYNNSFSRVQEINIQKYSYLYLINNTLYVYNSDKLSLSKIVHNNKIFSIRNLAFSDVTSVFQGIEVINIDNYSNYNILIEKPNKKANYIILSRYSDGWSKYIFTSLSGEITPLTLPNMFSVDSNSDVVVSFHSQNVGADVMSEQTPTYKFTIHTIGEPFEGDNANSYAGYDEKTALDEKNSHEQKANIMPKIEENKDSVLVPDEEIQNPPEQEIEPPLEND